MGDILSNQHLPPLTTEVYRRMMCRAVAHCVMMSGFDKSRGNGGVRRDMRERRSRRGGGGGRGRSGGPHAEPAARVNG